MLDSVVNDRGSVVAMGLASLALSFCASGCSGASEFGGENSLPPSVSATPSASATALPGLGVEEAERLCLEQVDTAPELTLEQMRELEGMAVYLCDVGPNEGGYLEAAIRAMTVPDLEASPDSYDGLVEQGYAQSLPYDSEVVEWCMDDSELLPDEQRVLLAGDQAWRTRLIFCDYNIEDD